MKYTSRILLIISTIILTLLAACGGCGSGGSSGSPEPFLLFSGNNGNTGLELFRSDGTAAGTAFG